MNNSKIISSRRDKYNSALKGLSEFYREPQDKLVLLLIRAGIHVEDIANAMGVSKKRLYYLYPEIKGVKK